MIVLTCTRCRERGPFFRHDSDDNFFLGSQVAVADDGSSSVADVYLEGDRRDDAATLILRTSSDGPDYSAFPVRVVRNLVKTSREYGNDTLKGFETYGHALDLLDGFYSNSRSHLNSGYESPDPSPDAESLFGVHRWFRIFDKNQDMGGAYTMFWVVSFGSDTNLTLTEERYHLGEVFVVTRCQHSYDCCGNYYSNTPKIRRLSNGRYLIRQRFLQNV